MARIYVSFGASDKDRAEQLADHLRKAGHTVITDQSPDVITQIDLAQVVLILISPEAGESIRVVRDMSQALTLRKPLIPIIVKETPLPPELSRLQFIDATRDWDAAMRQLELAVPAIAPVGAGPVPPFQPPSPATMPQPAPAPPPYFAAPAMQRAKRSSTRFVIIGLVVAVILILALLSASSIVQQQNLQSIYNQTAAPTSASTRLTRPAFARCAANGR